MIRRPGPQSPHSDPSIDVASSAVHAVELCGSYQDELLTLSAIVFRVKSSTATDGGDENDIAGSGGEVSIPLGRSYDGRQWESTAGPAYVRFDCANASIPFNWTELLCGASLPLMLKDGRRVIRYEVESTIVESLSPEKDAVRLLIQGTFGPTETSISEIVDGGLSADEWISRQMDETLLPATSHRAHFRRRANSRLRPGAGERSAPIGVRSPCDSGSRWNRFAFTKQDVGKVIEIVSEDAVAVVVQEKVGGRMRGGELEGVGEGGGGAGARKKVVTLRIDGWARTEVEVSLFPLLDSLLQPPYILCKAKERVGGDVVLSSRSLPGVGVCQEGDTVTIPNPAISFSEGADISDGYVPDAILDDISPKVTDSKVLRALRRFRSRGVSFTCQFAATGPIFIKAREGPRFQGRYEYYMHDPRAKLLDADILTPGGGLGEREGRGSIPSGNALSTASYPSVPKTFLNEASCRPGPMQGANKGRGG